MPRRSSRRQFLHQSAAAATGFWVAGGLTPSVSRAAAEQVNIASIGVGGKGSGDCDQAAGVGNLVAVCDVDADYLGAKTSKYPKAKGYADFRKMLEEMDKSIDAVTVSTPDHTHALASMMAMKMGKHVYCQKPLTHTVAEARKMRETAKEKKVVTQMGNQGTAENGLRTGVEVVRAGVIGDVKEVHVWTNRPVWPQAPKITARPKEEEAVPKYLSWDLWLAGAPFRPFHHGTVNPKNPKRGTYHDFNWRGWWDFGTGALGDMACHTANLPFMALKLGYPTSVVGTCGELNPETYPEWAKIVFEFPKRGEMPPVKFTWYEGRKDGKLVLPPDELFKGEKVVNSGSLMVGTKGILYSPDDYGKDWVLLPKKDFEGYKKPDPSLPRNGKGDGGMKAEWVAGIKGGPAPLSNFDYAALLTETILLGNIAMKCGGKVLEWDGPAMKFTNEKKANDFLQVEYRKGWSL